MDKERLEYSKCALSVLQMCSKFALSVMVTDGLDHVRQRLRIEYVFYLLYIGDFSQPVRKRSSRDHFRL